MTLSVIGLAGAVMRTVRTAVGEGAIRFFHWWLPLNVLLAAAAMVLLCVLLLLLLCASSFVGKGVIASKRWHGVMTVLVADTRQQGDNA
jgi:cell division protein FtsW (lipid II flippase)